MAFQVHKQCDLCWRCWMCGCSLIRKTDENVGWSKEFILANRSVSVFEVTDLWRISFGWVKIFWLMVWTWIGLPPKPYCVNWLRSVWRIMLAHVKAITRVYKWPKITGVAQKLAVILMEEPVSPVSENRQDKFAQVWSTYSFHRVVYYEFNPQGETENHYYYIDTLQCLWKNMWKWRTVYLLTLSLSFSEFLAKHKMTVIPHCPSSPALVLCVFYQKDKVVLRGRRLSVVTMIASRLVWCWSLNAWNIGAFTGFMA